MAKIKTYRVQKVEVAEFEIPLPEVPTYLFETGVRRSIRIIPKFTTWNKERFNKEEELYGLDVTLIYLSFKCEVVKFTINVSDLEGIWNSQERTLKKQILELLVNDWGDSRTQEEFETDLNVVIEKLKEI